MDETILQFLKKKEIDPQQIECILRVDGKTCVCTTDGREAYTRAPVKDFAAALPDYPFISVNKGTLAASRHIAYTNNGTYYLRSGRSLQGRKRTAAAHRNINAALLKSRMDQKEPPPAMPLPERLSLLDDMPVAFCVIELVFDENHRAADFIFRYCNKAMAVFRGKTPAEILNRSFSELFPSADLKRLRFYVDVVETGTPVSFCDYSAEIGKDIFMRCFRPAEGLCACLLTSADTPQNMMQI